MCVCNGPIRPGIKGFAMHYLLFRYTGIQVQPGLMDLGSSTIGDIS